MKKLTVGILAHVDSGKTTLSEALLYLSGRLRTLGRVDKKDAFLDNFAIERERGITVFSKQAVFTAKDTEITLIDTPGHSDFSPEAERTLCILDAAILVISASDGVNGYTRTLWKLLERHSIPVYIFVNKIDLPNAGREVLLADLRRALSDGCMAVENLGTNEETAECDEMLTEAFLAGKTLEKADIARAVAVRHIFPVCFGSALKTEGVDALLHTVLDYAPQPEYREAFGARIFKITHTERGERLTHMKITGGVLRVKDMLKGVDGVGNEWQEKADGLRLYSGARYDAIPEAPAGTVCAVTGLTHTFCGEGLGFEPADFAPLAEPVLSYEMVVPEGKDAHGIYFDLKKLEEEEPVYRFTFREALRTIGVSVMGEVQLEILARTITEKFGFTPRFEAGRILYRETIADTVEGVGHYEPLRHYSEVHLILEPTERGSGLHFASDVPENELARNWQRLVLTHLAEKTHVGVLTGSPITDMKITLVAGRAHKKHTEGGDFREATYRAVRQGLRQAQDVLLEPWYSFELTVPGENVGKAMSDLSLMGARFSAPNVSEGGESTIVGTAPVSEMRNYASELAGYTRAKGRLSLAFSGYEVCHNADEVIAAIGYDVDADLENSADSVFCAGGAGFLVPWYEVEAHMHIESVLSAAEPESETERTPSERAAAYLQRAATDKELMAIFERTYGKIKHRDFNRPVYNPSVTGTAEKKSADKPRPIKTPAYSGKEYLLVDGYNIMFAWDELSKAALESLDIAREELIRRLCSYQGYSDCEIILVFDAYKVKKNPGTVEKFRNISVVYTKEAETADTYIERVSHELSKNHRVRVATSDGSEQMIILGSGALRVPAAAFHKELRDAEKAIREIISEDH